MAVRQPAWLRDAEAHVGFHEGPNNENPFGKHYGLDNEPWCALFISYVMWRSGHPLPAMQGGMPDGFAAVVYGMDYAKANGCWRPSWDAQPGDLIVYGWAGPGSSPENMHVGFVVSSGPRGTVGHTIEGNRGDQVERQTFVVGESVVLGTIDVRKLLALTKAKSKRPKPVPQPRHPHHPKNTGPPPIPEPVPEPIPHRPRRSPFYRAWLRFVRKWRR